MAKVPQQIFYRLATKNDMPQLQALVNAHYARKKNLKYFEWQFFDSFYPTICIVAENKGRIIGMFGLQRRTLNNGVAVGHLIDLLVDKNCQGRGIFKTMGEMALGHWRDVGAFTVLPNPSGRIASEKALGLKTIAKIDDWILRDGPRSKGATVSDRNAPNYIQYQTSQPYFQWRFEINPTYKYKKITVGSLGFAYTKKFTDPTTEETFVDIVDYSLGKSDAKSLASFWSQAIGQMANQGLKNISTWALPHTPLANILQAMGFERLPKQRYFCVKVSDSDLKHLLDITSWDLVQADAEIY